MKNVFVWVPAYGHQISATTWQTTIALQQAFFTRGVGVGFSTFSYPELSEARNMALTIWYDSIKHAEYMLFIDADMGFSPDLVLDMMAFDEPFIGTFYPKKTLPIEFVGSGLPAGQELEIRGYFMEVQGVGFGCTLIKREVVTKMLERWGNEIIDEKLDMHPAKEMLAQSGVHRILRVFENIFVESGRVSEDLSFCHRWRECGGKVWAAVGHEVMHVGMHAYRGKFLDVLNDPKRQIVAQAPAQVVAVPMAEAAE